MADILLVEDEDNARRILAMGLEGRGHHVVSTPGPAEAEQALKAQHFDVVLTDLRMEGRDAGLDVVRMSANIRPQAQVLLLTAYASTDTAVEAMKEGAFDYLTKPVSGEELGQAVDRALEAVQGSGSEPRAEGVPEESLIGSSPLMQRVRERLSRAAKCNFMVLITGESGTGKELAARYVHRHSERSRGPFVPVHCGAIPEGLFESELFGYRRGAFTGAESDRSGLIESANHGTLFLDEVGEMPLAIQVKLLRVLQDMRVRRVGEDRERKVDVRVVAATNRDLAEEVKQGRFREDLFYRLNVVPVHMPPLRQHPEDIAELTGVFIRRWGGKDTTITPDCVERLTELPFMGNVRELENLLQRMLALSEGGVLDRQLLDTIYTFESPDSDLSLAAMKKQAGSLDAWLVNLEKGLIQEALDASGGQITRAAKLLGISFRSLRYRLKKLRIRVPEK
ncbi:MAG: sigma-54 dependent transcriptional regulator [Mariprofundaceae bacterium]|nr:sigma-54 dependent transcriptional regulator [Mariprofundaceae bacterium]